MTGIYPRATRQVNFKGPGNDRPTVRFRLTRAECIEIAAEAFRLGSLEGCAAWLETAASFPTPDLDIPVTWESGAV